MEMFVFCFILFTLILTCPAADVIVIYLCGLFILSFGPEKRRKKMGKGAVKEKWVGGCGLIGQERGEGLNGADKNI